MNNLIHKYTYYALALLVYLVIAALFIDKGYFWDNVQQIGAEANWFLHNGLLSVGSGEYIGTGYHMPTIGYTTALMWNVFGQHIWVSHVYACLWSIVYIIFSYRLVGSFANNWTRSLISLCLVLPTTVISQFAIASPDFIMIASIAVLLYGASSKRHLPLSIGLFVLCIHSMRGVFAGGCIMAGILWLCHKKELEYKKVLIDAMPTALVLAAYYGYYLICRGWFFDGSNYAEHYSTPTDISFIIKHFCSLAFRLVEYGRVLVWCMALLALSVILKKRIKMTATEEALLISAMALLLLYSLFAAITQMPFGTRCFMPLLYIITLFSFSVLSRLLKQHTQCVFATILLLGHITGHFWIYPEKIAQPWDSTLCHYGYYETKDDVMDYLDRNKIDTQNVAAGFCFNMEQINYNPDSRHATLSKDVDSADYYLYSNISNDDDAFVYELFDEKGGWSAIAEFRHGYVNALLFKRGER